jgi:hypothetical protein
MSHKFLGPMVGVGVSVLCSSVGAVIARATGGDVTASATLAHVAASVVLLVSVLVRLES